MAIKIHLLDIFYPTFLIGKTNITRNRLKILMTLSGLAVNWAGVWELRAQFGWGSREHVHFNLSRNFLPA